jgi:3-oxoacyl-[acyl-carrier protein] reductase
MLINRSMTAVVTGATRGIGKAIARELVAAGYHVAIGARNKQELDEVVLELSAVNSAVHVIGISADFSREAGIRHFAETVQEHFEAVDVLVNNAGTFVPASLLNENDDAHELQWKMHVLAPYLLCRAFGRGMRDRRSGHIFSICSIAALHPVVGAGSYTVTKTALLGLSRVLREELMPHQVKVTAIIPGSTLTSSWDGTDIPPERFISPDDIASAVMSCLRMSPGANVDELVIRPVEGQI